MAQWVRCVKPCRMIRAEHFDVCGEHEGCFGWIFFLILRICNRIRTDLGVREKLTVHSAI
jgi:hypothetical protein